MVKYIQYTMLPLDSAQPTYLATAEIASKCQKQEVMQRTGH